MPPGAEPPAYWSWLRHSGRRGDASIDRVDLSVQGAIPGTPFSMFGQKDEPDTAILSRAGARAGVAEAALAIAAAHQQVEAAANEAALAPGRTRFIGFAYAPNAASGNHPSGPFSLRLPFRNDLITVNFHETIDRQIRDLVLERRPFTEQDLADRAAIEFVLSLGHEIVHRDRKVTADEDAVEARARAIAGLRAAFLVQAELADRLRAILTSETLRGLHDDYRALLERIRDDGPGSGGRERARDVD